MPLQSSKDRARALQTNGHQPTNRRLNMKSKPIARHLAIGAVAAMVALPAFAQDRGSGERDWVFPWMPAGSGVIDTINGNDFRDNRDSTLSRNDVPVDQTTLSQGDARQWSSSESAYSTALPATATNGADDEMAMTGDAPPVDDVAQRNETIVNEAPEPSLAAEDELGRAGGGIGESTVTARNPSGIESVQDATRQEVYTGQPGAGGSDDMAAQDDMLTAQ
jgi:hypothetical protein